MASNSSPLSIGRSEGFSGYESRAEQSKATDGQNRFARFENVFGALGDQTANSQWSRMNAARVEPGSQAHAMLNDGFTLYDSKTVIAQNTPDTSRPGHISSGERHGDAPKEKTAAEKAEDADVRDKIGAIQRSGMLNAEGRTGPGDVEYKMFIFGHGDSSQAYRQQFIGTDPITRSDIYALNPKLIGQLAKHFGHFDTIIHSHPNKPGMDPNVFSKEDIAESNASGKDSLLVAPDGRVFMHKANQDGRYMNPATIPDSMRIPDKCLGKFDAEGKFHKVINNGKTVEFESEGF